MPATVKAKPTKCQRHLLEQVAGSSSPLRVDADAGVIYRVKVLGRFSRNSHGVKGADNGTEYSPKAMQGALKLYEGTKVKIDHPERRDQPGAERSTTDTFGVLRNCVVESDESGEPAIWADLHFLTSHEMAGRVVEDVTKGLGVYGLSHNAAAGRERFDPASRRLVIEEIAIVRSVDLVDRPATNRNLWESERKPVTITLRSLLEGRLTKLSKRRTGWAKLLLEDDGAAPAMDAPMPEPAPDAGGDEDDALWSGFQAAIQKVLDSYKSGELDAAAAGKKIKEWITAHDKLTGPDEPEAAPEKLDDVEESGSTEIRGKNQDAQRRAMNYKDPDDKDESEELDLLRKEKAVRSLCESLSFAPTQLQVESLAGLSDDKKRRALIESFKGGSAAAKYRSPKSQPPGSIDRTKPTGKTRDVAESEAADDVAALRCE